MHFTFIHINKSCWYGVFFVPQHIFILFPFLSLFINFRVKWQRMAALAGKKRCVSRNRQINNDRICDYVYTFLIMPTLNHTKKKNTYTGKKKFQLHPNNNNNSTIETPMVPHIGCTTTLERVNTYKCNK